MFRQMIQNLIIVLVGCLTLVFLIGAIFSMLPTQSFGLQVKEQITASSSRIRANEENYVTDVIGNIKNTSDEAIAVQAISVRISDGKQHHDVVLEGFTLPPRTSYPLQSRLDSQHDFDRVISVTATVDGESVELKNATADHPISGITVLLLVLCAACALITVHACKIRYYMKQEATAAAQQ